MKIGQFNTIVPLKLDFVAQKKGGMAVSAVWRLVYFLAPCPPEPKEQTAAHRRDALCPSTKIQKQAAFGIKCNPARATEAQRRKTAEGSPKGVSVANQLKGFTEIH